MSYWEKKGKYQTQSDQIAKDVPTSGHAEKITVELYRCAQNVYYEIYNNGGCNMGMNASDDRWSEHSKNTQLLLLASYGIDTSKIDDAVEKMVEEYEYDREHDDYNNSESEAMVEELWKKDGFMDKMIDSVIEKLRRK